MAAPCLVVPPGRSMPSTRILGIGSQSRGATPDLSGPGGGTWDPGAFRRLRRMSTTGPAAEKYGLVGRPRAPVLCRSHASLPIAVKVSLPPSDRP